MKLSIEYPRPSIGIPPGKRTPHLVYRRDRVEIDVPDLPRDAEHVVDYLSRGERYSVFFADGQYYTNKSKGHILLSDPSRLSAHIQNEIGVAVCGFAEETMKGVQSLAPIQSPDWYRGVSAHLPGLPERSQLVLRQVESADPTIDHSIDLILSSFTRAFVSVGDEVYERCEEPRIELKRPTKDQFHLEISTKPYPNFAQPSTGPFQLEYNCPVAYFPVDREEEARSFVTSNFKTAQLRDFAIFENLEYRGYGPMRGLEGPSLEAVSVRIEDNARIALLGAPGSARFGAEVLDDVSIEAILAYRRLRHVVEEIKQGADVDPDKIAAVLDGIATCPEWGRLNHGDLPIGAMLDRWHDRPLALDIARPRGRHLG
ncbi:hypothetical protein O9X98_05800 [Agrobacterium salinitolerans]|nr:hypothetical protein [Agrobacterium salinitolerans]